MNRLAHESSPYLQQHASNPVDCYPWGDEAIALAGERDWPIFLSIGYSACHWCHVMEHESFNNTEISELMNQNFINIKVDREERPDLDQIYMSAVTDGFGKDSDSLLHDRSAWTFLTGRSDGESTSRRTNAKRHIPWNSGTKPLEFACWTSSHLKCERST